MDPAEGDLELMARGLVPDCPVLLGGVGERVVVRYGTALMWENSGSNGSTVGFVRRVGLTLASLLTSSSLMGVETPRAEAEAVARRRTGIGANAVVAAGAQSAAATARERKSSLGLGLLLLQRECR